MVQGSARLRKGGSLNQNNGGGKRTRLAREGKRVNDGIGALGINTFSKEGTLVNLSYEDGAQQVIAKETSPVLDTDTLFWLGKFPSWRFVKSLTQVGYRDRER